MPREARVIPIPDTGAWYGLMIYRHLNEHVEARFELTTSRDA